MLPFTHHQFVLVFSLYNGAIWPLQPIVHVAGIVMLVFLLRPSRARVAASGMLLAAMWIWTGMVYQIGFFSRINPVALAFGALFVLQGLLLLDTVRHGRLAVASASGLRGAMGWALLLYSIAVYPLLGSVMDSDYFRLPAFGLTPCPVTLTTLGMLLLASRPVPRRLWAIPIAWSLIGGSAAALLAMPQDWILLVTPFALGLVAVHERFVARAPASRRT